MATVLCQVLRVMVNGTVSLIAISFWIATSVYSSDKAEIRKLADSFCYWINCGRCPLKIGCYAVS